MEDLAEFERELIKRYEEWMREHPGGDEPIRAIPSASTATTNTPQNDPGSNTRGEGNGWDRNIYSHHDQCRIQEDYFWRQDVIDPQNCDDGNDMSSIRTTLAAQDDLKSFEAAVLARQAPTTLRIGPKPRRKTRWPGRTDTESEYDRQEEGTRHREEASRKRRRGDSRTRQAPPIFAYTHAIAIP